MRAISTYDILFGVNDMWHFVHEASNRKNDCSTSLHQFFEATESKRRWSLVNPGSLLIMAYAYFVYGQENKLLEDFPSVEDTSTFVEKFVINHTNYNEKSVQDKAKFIKRRLRNSIAHCRYSIEIRTEDGEIRKDGDIFYKFHDQNKNGGDEVTLEISLPNFGNIIEKAGAHSMKVLRQQPKPPAVCQTEQSYI